MQKLFLIFALTVLFIPNQLIAQDTLYKTTSEKIVGKIFSIDTGGVSLRREKIKNDSVYFSKYDIAKIIYKNKLEINFTGEVLEKMDDVLISMHTEAVKIEFAGILAGKLVAGYEVHLNKSTCLDFRAGYIGVNFAAFSNFKASSGFLVKAGTRFYQRSKYSGLGNRFVHPLKGNYFMPQLLFSTYQNEKNSKDELTRNDVTVTSRVNNYGLSFILGHQYVGKDGFILDYSIGVGMDYQQNNYPQNAFVDADGYDQYAYSHVHIGRSIGFIITLGFAIGGLL